MPGDGRMIAGRYRLGARIGSGAMGVVWRATDERLNREVAVKELVLPPGMSDGDTERARTRALREGRIAARLRHPNAVSIYDVAEDNGHPVLVMEYVAGRSLATMLGERHTLPEDEVATIGASAASALAAAHAAGIVHRDVKPGNVLVAADGTVKITDFGVARAAGDVTVTATGVFAGTPAYLSPEVARGADATAESDVFSLGATLYAAVEGRPPFGDGDNPMAVLHAVASGEVDPMQRASRLAGPLGAMLDPEPGRRPSMAQVHTMLTGELMPFPASTRTLTKVDLQPVPPTAEPRRLPLIPIALAVLALAGATVAAVLLAQQDPAPADTRTPAGATATQLNAADLERAVGEYYALVPERTDEGWQRLGPGLQAQGRESYEEFWKEIKSVDVVDGPRATGQEVYVVIELGVDGGDRLREDHRLGMLVSGGSALIDSDRLVSSQRITGGDKLQDKDKDKDEDKGKDEDRDENKGKDGEGDGGEG